MDPTGNAALHILYYYFLTVISSPDFQMDLQQLQIDAMTGDIGGMAIDAISAAIPGLSAAMAKGTLKAADKMLDTVKGMKKINTIVDISKNRKKVIVIGEGMGDVKKVTKQLQKQKVKAKWYQAWSKYFPKNRRLTHKEMKNALSRNERWIKTKIKEGYEIVDIGIDPSKTIRSPFYQKEKETIKKLGKSVIKLN